MAAASAQAATRGKLVRDDIKGQHTAAASMQAATRGKQQRDELKGQHTAAASMQAATRGKQQRDEIEQADQFEEDMRAICRGSGRRRLRCRQRRGASRLGTECCRASCTLRQGVYRCVVVRVVVRHVSW